MIDIQMNHEGTEGMRIDLHTSYLIKTTDTTIYDIFVYPLTYIHNFIRKPSDDRVMKAAVDILHTVDYFCKISGPLSGNAEDYITTSISIYNELRENVNVNIVLGYLFHVYMEIINLMDKYSKDGIKYTDSNIIKYIFNNGMECTIHLDNNEIEMNPVVDEGEEKDEIH